MGGQIWFVPAMVDSSKDTEKEHPLREDNFMMSLMKIRGAMDIDIRHRSKGWIEMAIGQSPLDLRMENEYVKLTLPV